MKKLTVLLVIITMGLALQAQETDEFRTVFNKKPVKVSGFISPFMTFSTIDGQFAHFMGGGGGVLVNNFFIGGAGKGLTTSISYKTDITRDLKFSYGGFLLGYNILPKSAVHASVHSIVGWGNYRINEEENLIGSEHCFVVEPTVELELNIFEFFKFGVGASYRYVSLIEGPYSSAELSGPGVFMGFKFGWFK